MNNSQFKKKILPIVVIFVIALCFGICAFFGINANSSGGKLAGAATNNFGALNSADGEDDVDFTYEYGQSYTINGTQYKISDSKQEYYIPYKPALGLSDSDTVTLTKFTDLNGVDKTSEVGGIRKVGLYEFNVTKGGVNQTLKLRVNLGQLDYSTTDVIPVFVNANSPAYRAHGDITAVYKHNDGWYPSQKADEVPVEIRTITNAYYYLNDTTSVVAIKIGNETLPNGDTSTTSTIPYDVSVPEAERVIINITNRSGVKYSVSNEYIATFTFNAPENYVFTYGNAGEDDEITDAHKGLSITQRTPTSFVLVKHWFLVKYTSLFVSKLEPEEAANKMTETNDPYVPFHDKQKFDNYINGLGSNDQIWYGDGQHGESDTSTDTITYGDDLHVKIPSAKFKGGNYGTIKFDVIYVDLSGKTHKLATQIALDETGSVAQNTLPYYFNKTMPAGRYTLKLYGDIAQSQLAASEPNQIKGEYWLTVLPAQLDSSYITGANGIQDAIKGTLQSNGEFLNSYLLSENVLHKDLSEEIDSLNATLNLPLKDNTIASYWRDLSENEKREYFESAVTVKYNRSTWSSTNYVTYDEINQMITQAGNYTLYYSIAAKNYVTVGGPDAPDRTDYGFVTRLSQGVSIKEIYDRVYNNNDPYFKNVTYTGEQVQTLVPRSQQYEETFDDEDDYINVRARASVTLTLQGSDFLTGWENDADDGDLGDRIELSDDKQTLTIYFDIVPATNSWTVAPQMSPWTYGNYSKEINFITDGLVFTGATVYYRIGEKVGNSYQWVDVGGNLTVQDEVRPEFFTVNEDGEVDDEVAKKLKALGAGTYYICGYINPSRPVEGTEDTYNVNGRLMQAQGYSTVVVMRASNSWTDTPYILDWAYNGFNGDNVFHAGETQYGDKDDITYSLYSGADTTGTAIVTFKTLDDVVDGEKISDTLNDLDKGTYTLVAYQAGNDHNDYTALSLPLRFAVSQANNSWTITPFVSGWEYNKFVTTNVRAGEAVFGEKDEDGIVKITYELYEGDAVAESSLMHTFHGLTDTVEIDGNDVLVSDMLKALQAKTYTIVASVAGTDNYSGLSLPLTFAVNKASNTWTTMPVMTGWAYKLFAASNFQAGATEQGNRTAITYTLYGGTATTGTPLITLSSLTASFTLDQDDIDYFTGLEKGTYTLVAHQEGSEDYGELNHYMTFSVTQATNAWTVTPYITGWIYKQFTANNFQAGVTEFGETTTITYKLYAGATASGTVLIDEFKTLNDNVGSKKVSDIFVDLPKGTYTLLAHQDGTESYGVLNTPLTFTVTPTTNSWATKPRVIDWTYGSFDSSYFIAGVPTFQESTEDDAPAVVRYTLTKDDDESFTPVEFTTLAGAGFASLAAGSYTINVSYVGTDNYATLTDAVEFTVGKYTNSWNPSPSLRGWGYKNFNSALFTAGVPAMQDDEDAEVTYKVTGGTLTEAITLTVTNGALSQSSIDALTALAAGSYTLTATYPKTDNYDGITATYDFTVSKIDNGWTTRPRLLGWTYGAFESSYFIAGVPTLQEDDSVQVQYVLTKDGDDSFTAVTFTTLNLYDFATLNAGAYTLTVYYAGTDNYEELDDTVITFTVSKVNNAWDTQPTITGFVYKQFTEENSFVAGVPHYPLSGKQVYYVISAGAVAEAKTLTAFEAVAGEHFDLSGNATLNSTIVNYLNGLSFGKYYFAVFVPESDNYTYLFYTGSFNVSQTGNYWQNATPPDISGWVYGAFTESLFKSGAPIHGTATYTVRTVVNGNADAVVEIDGVPLSGKSYDELKAKLNGLNAGTYSIQATSGSTNDYTAAEWSKQFVVAKADNEWDSAPSIVGWIYGQYDDNVNAVNVGTAKYGDLAAADYTYKYYVAVNENGTWVKGAAVGESAIKTANAGNYLLEVTADGSDNYNALVHTVNFVIERKELAWNIEPDDRLDWDRKNTDSLNNSTIVKASVQGVSSYTLTYTVYRIDDAGANQINEITVTVNGATRNDANLITALKGLPIGTYRITVKAAVDATSNYETLEKNVSCTVSLAANEWNVELSGGTWTWGNSATVLNALSTPDADYGNNTIVFTVKDGATTLQTINADNDLDTAFGALKTYLGNLSVGTYTVTVSIAATTDYVAPQTTTVEFTVNKVTTVWNAATTANNGKVYNWVLLGSNEAVLQPQLGTPSWGKTVTYALKQGNANVYSGNDWDELVVALNNRKVGEYTVTAHVDGDDNHTALDYSVTVNITIADNEWNTELNGGTWTWKDSAAVLNALNKPDADHGNDTIVFTVKNGATTLQTVRAADSDLDTAFGELKTYLGNLSAGTYTVTVSIAATTDYVAPQSTTAEFTVNKVTTVWNAATTANNGKVYNWVLGGANEAVAQPVIGTPEVQLGSWGGTVNYKILKGAQEVYGGTAWSGLVSALGNQKAGEYTVTAHIDGDTNHTALDYSVTVNIGAKANSWTDKTGNGTSTAKEYEKTYGSDLSFIKFIPAHGTVAVTVNGKTTNDVIGYINSNGVGEYLIVATVTGTDEYGALVDTVRLTIIKADNTWNNDLAISSGWTWSDNHNNIATGLTLPVSAQGDTALVVVTVKQTDEVVLEATINYVRANGVKKVSDNDFAALESKLKALGVVSGGYTVTVTVSETDSYNALGDQSADFAISKATNSWATGGEPTISGWNFGGDTAYPSATPVFGKNTVVFTYAAPSDNDKFEDGNRVAPADDAVWQNAPSYQAGSYWLRASVAGTDNYSALVGYYLFTIKEGENKWVNMPGVIAWNWNGYDATVNLFSGSARSNKPAQFSITKADKSDLDVNDFVAHQSGVIINVDTIKPLKKFKLIENGVVVSDDVAKLLNALKPATYTLTVTVDGGESLESITGSTTFTVGKATNSWMAGKAPAMSGYTYGSYNATTTFTYGETVYGTASAVIYKLEGTTLDNAVVFTSNESKAAYVQLQEYLTDLGAGSYTLSAWVEAGANGTYSALYSSGSPYTTRSFTVTRATNGWTTTLVNQINQKYSDVKAAAFTQTEFAKLYAELEPIEGTVGYALLNADYTSRNTDTLNYAGLFNAIKALPAGEYVIRATVAETTTTNYFGIGATDTRLIISSHDNEFTQIPDALTAQWACGLNDDNETVNKTVLNAFEVKAAYGEDTVTYTLNKTTYESYAELEEAVSALNAGSYNVTIAIASTDDYAGLSEVRMLTVTQGQNSWQNDWAASGSLSVTSATRTGLSWDWKSTVTWTKAIPVYGKTVYVEIRKKNASSALQYVTLDYGVSNGDTAVATISEAISKLDVGDYELIVSAPATVNWAALSDTVEFSITKVSNSWNKAPQIGGANGNKWAYGTNAVPDADAKYGDVRYEYETKSGAKLTSMPTSAGEYVIKFIVDDTINYDGISGALNVTIEKATNRTVANLSVIGWTWGSYDREINVITGTPETTELENATIKFSIGTGMGDSFAALPDLSEFTLTANGLVERDSKVEAALRKLTGGTSKDNNLTYYTVRIHVGETTNYTGFTADNRFAVTGAANTFTKYPTIKAWEVNHWTDEFPSAVALYGAPEITITGETDGVTYFKGEYKENEDGQLELFVEFNELNLAPRGEYVLTATVKAAEGKYNSPLVGEYRFNVDVKGAGQANYWEELPTIDGWVANIDGLFNSPTGKPVRGLPNFVFYVRNADGTRGQKVDASLTNVVLKKGSKYEADIYVPVEYGDYILVASSKGIPDEEGKSDALAEYEIRVIIDPRPLAFEQELRIPTLLYLGDRKDWADPTSKPSLDDAEITYVYTNKETGVSSTEMPTVAGEYTVTATLSARYSNSVSMSVDFSVKLSPNGWTAAPNIKDWSEESIGNLPTGAATVGSDQIKYTYANVKEPNKILTERPTTEGSYIMYADVNIEGYEPLHAEYRFTIEPAFDTQLVVAAIVLGVFACLLACVVIYFAIKRYKEN